MSADKEEKDYGRHNKVLTVINTIISALFTLLFLAILILTEQGFFRLIISAVWLIYNIGCLIAGAKKNKNIVSILSCVIVIPMLWFMSAFPIRLKSETQWRYNFQRQYIRFFKSYTFKHTPDELPDEIEDYCLDYQPSLGQGAGHSNVRFKASEEIIKAYESEYAPKAIYTYPLSSFEEGSVSVEEVSPEAQTEWENDTSLVIHRDIDFWKDNTTAMVYVLSATHNWNHPHSTAVIIDSENGMIEFAQIG
ncbi:MAG: hypothetical protein J6L05_06360 [Ruminococcus sp.]|nr:hypothetical protein [Ruminococcus sp.]